MKKSRRALARPAAILPQSSQTMHYQCGTTPLTVALDGKRVKLADGWRRAAHLKQVLALTGAKYSDGKYTFWSKDRNAYLERNGKVVMSDCVLTSDGRRSERLSSRSRRRRM
ncbi:MliC family protein [Serratia marcescens]|uniref:MliC family protein n=1 Tax=Serratia marcescens TaxID=615 RepID=A0A939NQ73_SERMA|nr:MliC family protein [Serratia marcescens]